MSGDSQAAMLLVSIAALVGIVYILVMYVLSPFLSWIKYKLPERKRDREKIERREKWRDKWLWKPLFGIILLGIVYFLLRLIWFLLTGIYEAAKCFIEVG